MFLTLTRACFCREDAFDMRKHFVKKPSKGKGKGTDALAGQLGGLELRAASDSCRVKVEALD